MSGTKLVPSEPIERAILLIRGERVLLDRDLARLYGVETRTLIQAVKRNAARFPGDFMFRLTAAEQANLRSQSVMSSWGGRRHSPYAFTEHGVAMLSAVLRSERAIEVSIVVVRAFVRLRQLLATHAALARRLTMLEAASARHDTAIRSVFDAMRELTERPPTKPASKKIGFSRRDAIARSLRASRTRNPAAAR